MSKDNILIIGGKGKTGRKVAERLTKLGKNIRIGSRSESPAFDWNNQETWPKALEGMQAVYITYQPDLAVPGGLDAIKAFTDLAVKHGVQKLVLLSGRGEKEAQASEQIVINSGVDYTIVRCDWFNQNFSESFFLDPILSGHVALPRAEALVAYVDTDDIADVVTTSFINDKHARQVYELTGTRLLTFEQVVAEIAKATGRAILFQSITLDEYTAMLKEYQVPEDYIWLINYLFSQVLDGRNSSITNDVEKILGRKAKDFTEYVHETAASGVWNP